MRLGFLDRKRWAEQRDETFRQRPAGVALFQLSDLPGGRVAELDGATARHPVVVVGAGPIA